MHKLAREEKEKKKIKKERRRRFDFAPSSAVASAPKEYLSYKN